MSSIGKKKGVSSSIVMDKNEEDNKAYTKKQVNDINGIVLETHDVKIGWTMDHRSFRDDPMNNVDRTNKNWSIEDLDGYIKSLKEHLIGNGKLSKENDELYFFVGDYSSENNTTYRRVKDIEMYVALDSDISNVTCTPSLLTDSTAVLLKYYTPTKTRNDGIIVISSATIIYRNHRATLSCLGRYNSYEIITKEVLLPLSEMIPQLKFYIPDDSHVGPTRWFREVTGCQMCSIIRQDIQGARKRKQTEKMRRWNKVVVLDENKKHRTNIPNSSSQQTIVESASSRLHWIKSNYHTIKTSVVKKQCRPQKRGGYRVDATTSKQLH